jgi:hypothetical protein
VNLIVHGFFDVCGTQKSMTNLLNELKTKTPFLDFGDKENVQHQGSRKDLVSFKLAVDDSGAERTEDGVYMIL